MSAVKVSFASQSAMNSFAKAQGLSNLVGQQVSSGNRLVNPGVDLFSSLVNDKLAQDSAAAEVAKKSTGSVLSILNVREASMADLSNTLQEMRNVTLQLASGGLGDDDRVSLIAAVDALKTSYERTVSSSVYKGINIADGSFGAAGSVDYRNANIYNSSYTMSSAGGVLTALSATPAASACTITVGTVVDGDTLTVCGTKVYTFRNIASAPGEVAKGASPAETALNLLNALASATDDASNKYTYSLSGAVITATSAANTGSTTINGQFVNSANAPVASSVTGTATAIDLRSITSSSAPIGAVANVAIKSSNINASSVTTAATYGLTGTATDDFMEIQFNVGNRVYNGMARAATGVAISEFTCRLASDAASGPFFKIPILNTTKIDTNTLQATAIAALQADLPKITFYQTRGLALDQTAGDIVVDGASIGTIKGMTANLKTDNFNSIAVDTFDITNSVNNFTFSATVGGVAYSLATTSTSHIFAAGTVLNLTDSSGSRKLDITLGNKNLDLSSTAKLAGAVSAFKNAFGNTSDNSFIVGVNSATTFTLNMAALTWSDLFVDGNGTPQTLTLTDVDSANTSLTYIDNAINTLKAQKSIAGAYSVSLSSNIDQLDAFIENVTEDQERISGVNTAEAAAMLAQVRQSFLQIKAAYQAYQQTVEIALQLIS